jgi:hypothetical protein
MIKFSAAVMTFLIAGAIYSGSVQAQEGVPIHEEPFHQLVERQNNMRILNIQIPPGQTTLYHIHARPVHYVMIQKATTHDQILGQEWTAPEADTGNKTPQDVIGMSVVDLDYITSPKTHRVKNADNHLFHLIAVISDGDGGEGYTEFQPTDWTSEPFTNHWFTSGRMEVSIDMPSNWTTADNDTVLINPKGAPLMLSYKDAANAVTQIGLWQLIKKDMTYRVSNIGNSPASLVIVGVR